MRVKILPMYSIGTNYLFNCTTQLYQYFSVLFFYLHYLVTSMKYSFLNTPKQQYTSCCSIPEGNKTIRKHTD